MSDSATDQAKPTRPLFRVPFASDGNAARFLRGAGGTLVVQVAGAGLLFASQAVFARFLGVESFGIYVLAYAWLNVLLLAARQGFDVATVRFVAAYRAKSEWGLFRGYLGFSRAIVLAASVAIAGAMALATWWFRSRLGDEAAWAFWFAAATLPLFAQAQVHEAAIRGLGTVVRPLIFLRLLHPALLAVVLPLAVLGFGAAPTANVGMAIYFLATAVSLAGLWAMLRARCPQAAHGARPATEPRKWLNASFAMMFLMSFGPILNQICVIVLGALDGNAAAGQYGAAVRISYIVQPLIIAQTIAIAPLAADLHASGDVAELQRIIRLGVRMVVSAALAVAVVVIAFGQWILGLLGEDFVPAYPILIVLIGGHLLFAAAGPAAIILNMTGFHGESAKILAVGAAVSVAASVILIPAMGALGAALATVLAIACTCGLMAYAAFKRLGLITVVTVPRRAHLTNS